MSARPWPLNRQLGFLFSRQKKKDFKRFVKHRSPPCAFAGLVFLRTRRPATCMSRANPAFTFRKCLCGVEDCRRLTEALSRLAPDRAGYETLPEINATPGKPTTAHWRKVALRDGILRHLGLAARYAVGRTVYPTDNAGITSQHFISRIHWHPALTALTVGTGTATNKLTVQSGLARDISFTNVDLVDKKVGKPAGYLALPSWTIAGVRVEISDAEALVQRTPGPIPSIPAAIPPRLSRLPFLRFRPPRPILLHHHRRNGTRHHYRQVGRGELGYAIEPTPSGGHSSCTSR